MSDVPEGYRMSEVGVIPEDWDVKELGEILKVKHGKSQHEIIDVNGAFPILATGGVIGWTNVFLYDEPSVLIGRKGTIDVPQYMESPFWTIDTLFYTEIFKNTFPKFIFYKFNTIDWYSFNEASGVPSLNAKTIEKIQIPLPPLPEQQAIASALSDVDALITALEQLIIKKRNIKQGAMQQLLTGEKRLPGFSGKWEVKTLENVCAKNGLVRGPFGGTLKKEFFVRNGLKVYEQKNAIYRNVSLGNYFIDKNKFNELKRFEVKKGDFIVSCSGTIGKIYQIPNCAECGIINQALLKIKTDNNIIHDRFFFYYFDWEKFQEKIIDNTQGGAMQNLVGMNIFRNTQILLPPLPEQQAIAQILSDMDTEIEALEQKRDKYKTIKQGMMQELLTGKTRLAKEDKT